jgi:hypothetical protein
MDALGLLAKFARSPPNRKPCPATWHRLRKILLKRTGWEVWWIITDFNINSREYPVYLFFIGILYFSWQNYIRMPQAKSSEKYQVPPKKLLTPIFLAVVVPNAYPEAQTSVYLQLWDFELR